MLLPLTRSHCFLLPDSAISLSHLTYYSKDVLSDAGQIETHWTAPVFVKDSFYVCGCMHVRLRD